MIKLIENRLDLENNAINFQKGFLSFKTVTQALLNGSKDESIRAIQLKSEILAYIRKKKEAYLSELIEEFDVEPSVLIKILNELKEKKLIRRVE